MCQLSNDVWLSSIESIEAEVIEKYGTEPVTFILNKYGASCADDLNPSDYSEVYGELLQMSAD